MTSLFHYNDIPWSLLEISSESDFLKGAVIAKIMVMSDVTFFSNSTESKEPDYDKDEDQLKEKQEEQTGKQEIINQVF